MKSKVPALIFFFLLVATLSCKKKDSENPMVMLHGNALMTILLNSSFTDPGAEAYDNNDGELQVETEGTVDTNFAGTYNIVYSAYDAAGNSGQAVRTVIVRNEAEIYNGSYDGACYTSADTTAYIASVVVSNILNKRIWIAGFALYPNASVFADISSDSVFFPSQVSLAGTPAIVHKFGGTGLIKTVNDTTVFEINYTDSVSGLVSTGIMVYKK